MIKIIDNRGTGKTYRLCQYAIENNCDILVPTSYSITYVLNLLEEIAEKDVNGVVGIIKYKNGAEFVYSDKTYRNRAINIMTPGSLKQSRPPERKLVVDEAERVLAYMLAPYGYSYDGYTISKE